MADFTYVADRVVEEEIQFDTLISEAENGYEQRRYRRQSSLRRFKLYFDNRVGSEMEDVRDFFISKKGAYSDFTWENPNDSTEYTVRFEDDTLKMKRIAFNIYSFQIAFREVRA